MDMLVILVGLVLLLVLTLKKIPIVYAAMISIIFIALFSGMPVIATATKDYMTGFAVLLQGINQLQQYGIFVYGAVFDGGINAGQILHDNTAGTEIHVADFGISHLSFGQTDRQPGSFNKASRIIFYNTVPVRCMAVFNGIIRRNVVTIAPAVKHKEHYRFLCHIFPH